MDTLPQFTIPRESKELLRLTVTDVDSGTVLTQFEVCLVEAGARPTGWRAADTVAPFKGFLMPGTLPPNVYTLWVRVTDTPEIPVRPYARITVT